MTRWVPALVAALVAGCGGGDRRPVRVAEGVTLHVPAGWAEVDVRVTDSEAVVLEDSTLRLTADYGRYGGLPLAALDGRGEVDTVRVGGRRVVLVHSVSRPGRGGYPYGFGALFLDAGPTAGGAAPTLSVWADCRTRAACEVAEGVARTADVR